MNYKIIYKNPTGSLLVKTNDRMNANDYIRMAKDILKHPRFSPDNNVMFDHKDLDFNDVSLGDLQKIRSFHRKNEKRIGNGKSAILVKYGLSKKWHKLWSQGKKIKTGNNVWVFENRDDAIRWLAIKPFRALDDNFMKELLKGRLKYILKFERFNRKSFMVEIRNNFLDLYFLGHTVEVRKRGRNGYSLIASNKFKPDNVKNIRKYTKNKWEIDFNDIRSYAQFENIMTSILSKIILHRKGAISEGVSELNHFIDNRAIGKNGTLIIDRQVVYPGIRESRIDLLGLTRLDKNKDKFTFSIIELKNKNNVDIGRAISQIKRYIDVIYDKKDIHERFCITYKKVLEQKIKLGLLKRIKCDMAKWEDISKRDIKGIVILDNFNIKGDLRHNGLLSRLIKDWEKLPKEYDIKLFLKTNVLDSIFFIDLNKTRRIFGNYRKYN